MAQLSTERTLGLFYRARVRDAMNTRVVTCSPETGARELAHLMRQNQYGSVVVVEDGQPRGIVTERDLVYKVLTDVTTDHTAREIMSSPLVTVTADDHVYYAVHLMMKHRCRRLVVVDPVGQPAGMISMQGLLRLEGVEGRLVNDHIDQAQSVDELCSVRAEIDDFVRKLFMGEVDSRTLTELVTDYNDAVTRRMLVLTEQRLRRARRAPAIRYAWVCFGSEGRKEQVLRGDQDNGIVIADFSQTPGAWDYFAELSAEMNADLAVCGYDLCDGGVMAREVKYSGTLSAWQDRVRKLVGQTNEGERLRDLTIFLDCRHVGGDVTLVNQLWETTFREFVREPLALRSLAEDALGKPVPINFLGRFQYDRDARGRKGIDVKKRGMLPLVAAVKVLAIDAGVRVTSTAERIIQLAGGGVLDEQVATDLLSALDLFLRLKLQDSLQQVFDGERPTSFAYPDEWTEWERADLKRAFHAVEKVQDSLRLRYQL